MRVTREPQLTSKVAGGCSFWTESSRLSRRSLSLVPVLVLAALLWAPRVARADQTVTTARMGDTITETVAEAEPQRAWDYAVRTVRGDTEVTIVLGDDWHLTSQLELRGGVGQRITVDLNGHAIIRDTGGRQAKDGGIFSLAGSQQAGDAANPTLTIRDSRPDVRGYDGVRGGVITGGANTNGGGAITVRGGATCMMEGGTIYRCTSNEHGGAVMLDADETRGLQPTFAMTGGRIYFCQTIDALTSCHGGAVYGYYAKVTLSSCTIDSCYSEDSGGGLYLAYGTLDARNVTMLANHCRDYGGAICQSCGEMALTDCRISSCEANDDGGGVYADDKVRVAGCVFTRNKSYGNGGALCIERPRALYPPDAVLVGCDITANSAAGKGGGVYVAEHRNVGVKGLVRVFNNSGRDGRNNVTLQYGANSALVYDGGLYEGSHIGLSSSNRNTTYAPEVSELHASYFFSDRGELSLADTDVRFVPLMASAFGDGELAYLVLGAGLALLAGVTAYAVLDRRRQLRSRVEVSER